jgi:hypothetical protein
MKKGIILKFAALLMGELETYCGKFAQNCTQHTALHVSAPKPSSA